MAKGELVEVQEPVICAYCAKTLEMGARVVRRNGAVFGLNCHRKRSAPNTEAAEMHARMDAERREKTR